MKLTKLGTMLLVAGACVAAHSQDQPEAVTVSCSGARLSLAVAELAAASKAELKVSPAIAESEVVAFRFKNLPLGVAMKKLALAVDGVWEQSGAVWTLLPDQGKREALKQADRRKKLEALRRQLLETLSPPKPKKVDPAKKRGEEEVFDEEAVERSSSDKAIAKMLLSADLGQIVDLPDQGRVVFSATPNRMQRPMRVDPAWLREVITEHNDYVQMMAEAKKTQEVEVDESDQKYRAWMKRMGMEREEVALVGPPSKILLVVEKGGFMGDNGVQASLKIYDAQGKTVITSSTGLSLGEYAGGPFGATDTIAVPDGAPPAAPPPPDPKSPKIEWSALAKEFEAFGSKMQSAVMAGGMPEIPALVRNAMARPDEIEPLSIGFGEGLAKAAELSEKQMVALIPDAAFQGGFDSNTLPTTVARFVVYLKAQNTVSFKEDGDWWTVEPKDKLSARKLRASRTVLGQFLRSLGGSKRASLEEVAGFAAKNEAPFKSEVAAAYLFIGAPGMMRFMVDVRQWDVLRFYGQLESVQRSALDGGRRLVFQGLSPQQAATVSRLVFGANPSIIIGPPPPDDAYGGLLGMMSYGMMNGQNESDYRQEPTELCPNGLPPQGFVSMQVKSEILLKPAKSGGWMEMMGNSGIQEIAMYQLMRENPAMGDQAFFPEVKEVLIGSRRNLNLAFQLGSDASIRRSLQDDKIPDDAQPVSMNNLPPEVKSALDAAIATLKKLDIPFLDPGIFGGRPPIPPRKTRGKYASRTLEDRNLQR